jgi:hypothetical protein
MEDLTVPLWLDIISIAFLLLAVACAAVVAADVTQRLQPMWFMNVVWPVTVLFGTVLLVSSYFRFGRGAPAGSAHHQDGAAKPFAVAVAISAGIKARM